MNICNIARINCYASADELVAALCRDFYSYITELTQTKSRIFLAISGGNTPKAFFKQLAFDQDLPDRKIDWSNIHFFWVDERCVPPEHPESNYGMAYKYLLQKIRIPEYNVHRIRGENNPSEESIRYEKEILRCLNLSDGIPIFDWIFLGIGNDGHTASIFPDQPELLTTKKICESTTHPVTGQYRITITGPTLIHAKRITFLVVGDSKSIVLKNILHDEPEAKQYPASFMKPVSGKLDWYMDEQAAKYVKTQ
jgi:6-phosphogluconolactonase